MKKLIAIILVIISMNTFGQTSSGVTWDRYYITGNLMVGYGTKNTWAHDALLLQIGKDTNTRGIKIPWVIDTSNVISPRPFGTEVGQLKDSTKYIWLGNRWSSANISGIATDTTSLSNRINQRVKHVDTSNMLLPYATKGNLKDTTTLLRGLISSSVVDTTSLSNRINQRVKYTDTSSMLAPYATKVNLKDTASLLRMLITSNSSTSVKYTDTAAMLAPYATKANLKDTATVLRGLIATASVDTSSMSNRINQRVSYSDTAVMLAPYATKVKVLSDSIALRNQINVKIDSVRRLPGSLQVQVKLNGSWVNAFIDSVVGASSGVSGSGTANRGTKFTGTSSVGNSLYYDDGTNIGFRTTNPLTPFQVNVGTNMEAALYVNSDGFPNLAFYNTAGSALTQGAVNANFLHLQNGGGANNLIVGSNTVNGNGKSQFWGNVWLNDRLGIGTSGVPVYPLDVTGVARVASVITNSSAPTVSYGTGIGTSGSPTTWSLDGDNSSGLITFTPSASPASGQVIFTLTLANSLACPNRAYLQLYPENDNAASVNGGTTTSVKTTGTATSISVVSGTLGLTSGSSYIFNYSIKCR